MLRVVIDTSSLVSYALTAGDIMKQVMAAWRAGEFILLSSPHIRAELAQVLSRPKIQARSTTSLAPLLQGVTRFSQHIPGKLILQDACRDPKDDKFLACAVEGKAQYLVSSDRDLLDMKRYRNVCILNPGQFLVALQLTKLAPEKIKTQYSLKTLRQIQAVLCLNADAARKLNLVTVLMSKNQS